MANPIKASDLYQDDGALDKLEAQLRAIGVAMDGLNKKAVSYAGEVKKHSAATRDGQKAIEESAKQAAALEKEQERLTAAYSDTNKQILALRKERAEANRVAALETKLAQAAEGSYDRLSAQYSLNKIKLNAMSKEMREGTKAGQELESSTKDIYEEMKRLQEATGKTSLNVGNYKADVKDAIKETFGFGNALSVVSKTPLLAVISLVVAALGALFKAFQRSERGAELMAKASGVVSGLMSALVGIANVLVDKVIALWEDPLGSLKAFGQAIVENVTNRFKGLINLGGALGKVILALFSRDLQGLKAAAKDAGQALVQMQTGLDADGQREFAAAMAATTKEALSQAEAFANLAAARREVARQNRELTKQAERLATQEQLAQVLADDATRSFAEREEQAEKARQALEARAAAEVKIARNNLGLIETEIALRRRQGEDVEGLLDQQLGAYSAVLAAEREYTVAVADNEKTRRELVQDRLERDLDILIDGFDNQKTINERIIANEEEALARRRAVLAETTRLAEESFGKQIETIQKFTGIRVDANSLIAESDAVVLNERIRALGLSEVIEGRLLEIIRERRLAVSDLAEAQRSLTKATRESAGELTAIVSGSQQRLLREQRKEAAEVIKVGGRLAERAREGLEAQGASGGLYSLLGIEATDENKQAVSQSLDFAKAQLASFTEQRTQAAQAALQAANTEVQAAQSKLTAEIAAAQAGYASRVDTARKDLELAEQAQAQAEKRAQRAQRAQLAAESIQQASSLITGIAKLWASPGWPLALPLTAVLFGSFAAAKIKAFQATKIFRRGGYEELNYAGSHESGRDISLGFDAQGTERRAERGEGLAVFSREAVARYGGLLPDIVAAINARELESRYQRRASVGPAGAVVNINTAGMEGELRHIRRNGERSLAALPDGRIIERHKNRVRIYV